MATGFVRGFDVGFNAVNSALRLAEMRRDAEHRRKREDEKWGYEKDELERKRTLAADLAAADSEPTSGLVVGETGSRNFADSPEEQSFLREQDAAIADLEGRKPSAAKIAVGVGRHILDPSDPRAQSGRRGYMARVASAYRRAGEVGKAINVEDIQREFERTRLKDAAQYLFVSRGDAAGTQRMWEEANGPLGGTLIAEPTVRKGADGTEIPDYTLSIRDEQGNVRPLGSAFTMLYMADNPAEYLKLVQGEQRAAAQTKRDERLLAQGDRRLDIAESDLSIRRARLGLEQQRFSDERDGGKLKREIEQLETLLGRPLTETERLAKFGIKTEKGGDSKKFIDDVAKEWAKNNPDATPSDVATFRADLERRVDAAPVELEIEARIKQLPPEQRAAAIDEAKQRFRLGDEWFKQRGIEVPPAQAPARQGAASIAASGGTAPPAPAPAQVATQREVGATETMYVNALAALRQQQERLGQEAKNAPAEQQADISRRIAALGEQIRRTKEEARSRGLVLE